MNTVRKPTSDKIVELKTSKLKSHRDGSLPINARKILIVEDDEGILSLLANIIRNVGFEVVTACDGQEALSKFESENPRLVLADIRMPRLTGIQLSNAIKDSGSEVPIILFSGFYPNLMEDKLENRINCDHVLYKPFVEADIIESLEMFLEMPRSK